MKCIDKQFMLITVGIIGIGVTSLTLLTTQVKEQIMKQAGTQTEVNFAAEVEKQDSEYEEILQSQLAKNSQEWSAMLESRVSEMEEQMGGSVFSYLGHVITVYDSIEDTETARDNSEKVMDIVLHDLQTKILDTLHINAEEYDFTLHRQIQFPDKTCYGVAFEQKNTILISAIVNLDDHSILAFTMDGLVDLDYADSIPKQYPAQNWAVTEEQKRTIYEDYLPLAQEIIENTLHYPSIGNPDFDPSNEDYIFIDEDSSNVRFGYPLENGEFIQLIFNRVNQKWNGFVFLT